MWKRNLIEEVLGFTPKSKGRLHKGRAFGVIGELFGLGFGKKVNSKSLVPTRLPEYLLFCVPVVFVLFVFIAKSFDLQITKGEDNLVLAEGNRVRVTYIQPERGLILDRNGKVIVRNKPSFDLIMNVGRCEQVEAFGGRACSSELSSFVEESGLLIDEERVLGEIAKRNSPIVIAPNLSRDDILSVEPKLYKYPSVAVSVAPRREYLYSDAFAHLVGYVGYGDTLFPTIEGKTGVESGYDEEIMGIAGGEIVQVDSNGMVVGVLSQKFAVPGRDVELFADMELQMLSYNLIKEAVDSGDATGGAVVVQDPRTGGVLALISYPSFDPNVLSHGLGESEFEELVNDPGYPFFNRPISAVYPPASTFKIIMSAAALSEGVVDEHFQVNDVGQISVSGYVYKGWKEGGHGLVDVRRALQVSNDIYFYVVGGGFGGVDGLGIKKVSDWARKYGFASKTGIDIPGEATGYMPDGLSRDWYLGDTYITSIGQGDVLATPIQVNNVTSYFANGGYLISPRVVKSIDGEITNMNIISQHILEKDDYDAIKEGLRMVVESGGTAFPFFDFYDTYGIRVAGKTGTAEFGGAGNNSTHAWFSVFAPYENAEIALTVFLEGGGSGSSDAAPIARRIFDYWFSR